MNYYNEIKSELINNEIYKRVKDYSKNKSDINTYYNVGKLLVKAHVGEQRAKYGNGLIKEYSKKMIEEVNKQYNARTLRRIRQFYLISRNWSTMSTNLSWSHYSELLILKDIHAINYYLNISLKENLSVRELRNKIKKQEYERLDEATKTKLISKSTNREIKDFIKHPIIIENKYNHQEISEKILKQLIIENLDSFLTELGEGFTYIKNEYKIKLGDRYNYIDLLLYNIKYNCYAVIELKITELKSEYIDQIQKYMNT